MARRIPKRIREHVRISEYSDLEILGVLADLNGTGAVGTEAMARRLFGDIVADKSEYLVYAKRCCGTRLGWMRRFGLVDKEAGGDWHLTNDGELLLAGTMRGPLTDEIMGLDRSRTLHLAQTVGVRIRGADDVAFKAMERQIRFNVVQRKQGR